MLDLVDPAKYLSALKHIYTLTGPGLAGRSGDEMASGDAAPTPRSRRFCAGKWCRGEACSDRDPEDEPQRYTPPPSTL
jgi:hypothetical protein